MLDLSSYSRYLKLLCMTSYVIKFIQKESEKIPRKREPVHSYVGYTGCWTVLAIVDIRKNTLYDCLRHNIHTKVKWEDTEEVRTSQFLPEIHNSVDRFHCSWYMKFTVRLSTSYNSYKTPKKVEPILSYLEYAASWAVLAIVDIWNYSAWLPTSSNSYKSKVKIHPGSTSPYISTWKLQPARPFSL